MTTNPTTIEAVSGHTPGPWFSCVRRFKFDICTRPTKSKVGGHSARLGEVIYWTAPAPGQPDRAAAEANARLIAAAPDLLEALEAQESASLFAAEVSLITPDGETVAKHLMDKADNLFSRAKRLRVAAIARARGEAQ